MLSVVLDVNGLSIRMAYSLRKTPTCEGVRRASSFFRDSVVPTPYAEKPMWSSAPRLLGAPPFGPRRDLARIPQPLSSRSTGAGNPGTSAIWWAHRSGSKCCGGGRMVVPSQPTYRLLAVTCTPAAVPGPNDCSRAVRACPPSSPAQGIPRAAMSPAASGGRIVETRYRGGF